jgi:hypothetical protein
MEKGRETTELSMAVISMDAHWLGPAFCSGRDGHSLRPAKNQIKHHLVAMM